MDINIDKLNEYAAVENLRDGRKITIRAIRPMDKQELLKGFHRLSSESIYFRLFTFKKDLTEPELERLTHIDFKDDVGLVVWTEEDGKENLIGGGRYNIFRRQPLVSAEVAFSVVDDYHGKGIASLVLKHLAAIGRKQGVNEFYATVLPRNRAMLRVFEKSGLPSTVNQTRDEVEVHMQLNQQGDY